MKLEGIVTCVAYSDFLSETLLHNLRHFDKLMVVTAPEDRETQRIARYYGVPHCQTDKFRSRWGEFNKAAGINAGLAQLDKDGWILHFDADIILPPKTRELLERSRLDRKLLYGALRGNVPGHDAWRRHQAMPALQQDNYHVALDAFPLSPLFCGARMDGYAPPGFFQLWYHPWAPKSVRQRGYPDEHTSASRTDVLFATQWDRPDRALIPEFVVYHLESEKAPQGANWDGRQTKRWGADPVEDHHHPKFHKAPPASQDWRTLDATPPPADSSAASCRRRPPTNVSRPVIHLPPRYETIPRVGEAITMTPGQWEGTEPITFRYSWQRGKNGLFSDVPGATALKYVVQNSDVGYAMRAHVIAKNREGSASAHSVPTATVIA